MALRCHSNPVTGCDTSKVLDIKGFYKVQGVTGFL